MSEGLTKHISEGQPNYYKSDFTLEDFEELCRLLEKEYQPRPNPMDGFFEAAEWIAKNASDDETYLVNGCIAMSKKSALSILEVLDEYMKDYVKGM